MKKVRVYFSFAALVCAIALSYTKSHAYNSGHLLVKTNCSNSAGTMVANGCECTSGDSACTPNPCPKGTCQE